MTRIKDRAVRDLRLFMLANVFMGLGACVNSAILNNYLKEGFNLDVAARTFLEFPRELPGFLASLFLAFLALMGEVRIAMAANLLVAAGCLALGFIPASYPFLIGALFLYSLGQHLYMPLSSSIGMSFAREGGEGAVLGRIGAVNTAAVLAGTLVLVAVFQWIGVSYRAAYTAAAGFYFTSAVAFLLMDPRRGEHRPVRFVVRREYGRYYLLALIYGARKQLFITFAPWMLVDFFRAPVTTMTFLGFCVAALSIGVQPLVGRMTDRFGARAVLAGESMLVVGLCLAYAFVSTLLPAGPAFVVVAACYVVDQCASAVTMTRAVYAKSIVRDPRDLAATLTLDVSLDHAVTMFFPALGGILWRTGGTLGYRYVFLGGALVAALNFFVTRGIRTTGGSTTTLSGRIGDGR